MQIVNLLHSLNAVSNERKIAVHAGESVKLVSTEIFQSVNPLWVVILTFPVVIFFSFLKKKDKPVTPTDPTAPAEEKPKRKKKAKKVKAEDPKPEQEKKKEEDDGF